jgi:hypothetical protein
VAVADTAAVAAVAGEEEEEDEDEPRFNLKPVSRSHEHLKAPVDRGRFQNAFASAAGEFVCSIGVGLSVHNLRGKNGKPRQAVRES